MVSLENSSVWFTEWNDGDDDNDDTNNTFKTCSEKK